MMEIIFSIPKYHQLSSLLSSAAYCLAEKLFDKQTEKQVIAGAAAEESDLGKAFLPLSSTQTFPAPQ